MIQFKNFFYQDDFYAAEALLNHIEAMVLKGKVIDEEERGTPLTNDSEKFNNLKASQEYLSVREDRELFNYFYQETSPSSTGWIE